MKMSERIFCQLCKGIITLEIEKKQEYHDSCKKEFPELIEIKKIHPDHFKIIKEIKKEISSKKLIFLLVIWS